MNELRLGLGRQDELAREWNYQGIADTERNWEILEPIMSDVVNKYACKGDVSPLTKEDEAGDLVSWAPNDYWDYAHYMDDYLREYLANCCWSDGLAGEAEFARAYHDLHLICYGAEYDPFEGHLIAD